jgi:hypothetical protein
VAHPYGRTVIPDEAVSLWQLRQCERLPRRKPLERSPSKTNGYHFAERKHRNESPCKCPTPNRMRDEYDRNPHSSGKYDVRASVRPGSRPTPKSCRDMPVSDHGTAGNGYERSC